MGEAAVEESEVGVVRREGVERSGWILGEKSKSGPLRARV